MELNTEYLRGAVKSRMDDGRYAHTLGVERAAEELGKIYLPDRITELRCAALLHDITKNETREKQLQYIAGFDIMISDFDGVPTSLLHAVSGAAAVKRDFPDYASEDIVSAVRWHTTGRRDMTMFELIIYLADYIEDGREYGDCKRLREYFRDGIRGGMSPTDALVHLYKTAVMSVDMTLRQLQSKGSYIDPNTFECRDYYLGLLEKESARGSGGTDRKV